MPRRGWFHPIFRDSPRNKLLVVENMELDASERGEKHSVDGKTTMAFVESTRSFPDRKISAVLNNGSLWR